jgi:hypothetical protein
MKLSLLMLIVILPLITLVAQHKQHKQQIQLSAGWLNSTDTHEGVILTVGYERNIGKRFTIEGVYSNIMQMRGGWRGLQNIGSSMLYYTKPSTSSDAYPFEDRVPSNERNRKGIINGFERSNDDALHTISGLLGYTIIDKPKHRLQLKSGALVGYGSFVDEDESGGAIFTLSDPNMQPIPIFYESDLYSRNLFLGWHIYSIDYQYHIKKSISIGLRHSLTYFNNIWIQDLINYQITLSKHF